MNRLILFVLLLIAPYANAQTAIGGRLIIVNEISDSNDVIVGDGVCLDSNGKCTLRAAIQESSATGFNVISFALSPNSAINLTLGELLITKPLHIIGPGARRLTVQRSPNLNTPSFRVFHIAPNVGFGLIIRGLKIKNGKVDGDGGGLLIERQNIVYLNDVAVTDNSANRGGGIANAGIINMRRALINSNITTAATNNGGAIMNINAESAALISNTTLTENSAVNGGAVYNEGTLTLVNNTITNNRATNSGSSLLNAGGTINVLNTIIGMDIASSISSLSGNFNSLGNNLITDARNSTGFTNGVNNDQVSDNHTLNPILGNLTDNGGQTDTLALLPGSSAIDRGNNCVQNASCTAPQLQQGFLLSTDQRINYARRSGLAVDIGAYESGSPVINGSIGFGRVSVRPRLANSLVVLTNAGSGEQLFRTTNPFGNFRFSNLSLGEVYILEIKSKRAGLSSVAIFEFDNLPFSLETNSFNLTEDFEVFTGK
jgi:hypothetical protein